MLVETQRETTETMGRPAQDGAGPGIRRVTILEEAGRITDGDRQMAYGPPEENHGCTADLWTAYLVRKIQATLAHLEAEEDVPREVRYYLSELCKLDAHDVCMLNILQKCSRDANLRVRDNLVDIAGYARNAEICE